MNNADLKAFVDEEGPKIAVIICDNGYRLALNYAGREQRIEDIEYRTVGECDMFCVPRTEHWKTTDGRNGKPVKVRHWHLTECIQAIVTTEDPEYAPDPLYAMG